MINGVPASFNNVSHLDMLSDAWAQHNSTWNGKNSSENFADDVKQKFCDNVVGSPVPPSDRWLGHVSRADRAADRWLTGQSGAHRTVR